MYRSIWSSNAGEVFVANLDGRPEALEYDIFAVGEGGLKGRGRCFFLHVHPDANL